MDATCSLMMWTVVYTVCGVLAKKLGATKIAHAGGKRAAAKPAPEKGQDSQRRRISSKSSSGPHAAAKAAAATGSSASLANFVTQMNRKSKHHTLSTDEAKVYDHYKSLAKFSTEKADIVREWTTSFDQQTVASFLCL